LWLRETYIRESFNAAKVLALVRLLASMRPGVDNESTALNKALFTAGRRAWVWSIIRVDFIVSRQI
jgi:hypothetical protein